MRALQTVLLLITLSLSAIAQPALNSIAALAPADSLLTLSFSEEDVNVFAGLAADLQTLDWDGAVDTFSRLFRAMGEDLDLGELAAIFGMFSEPDMLFAEIRTFCPPLADALEPRNVRLLGQEGIITVSVDTINPVPAVTAITRFSDADAATAADVQAILLDCLEEAGETVNTLEQDGTTLYVLADGGDLPVIIGSIDNVYFAGTNPDVLRGIVRRAGGATEANLADSPLYARLEAALESTSGLGLSLDFNVLANLLDTFGPMMISEPEEEVLLNRALAMLRTLGGYSGVISSSLEGLTIEAYLAVDAEGGDDALASLLVCETCVVGSLPFFPGSSVMVAGQHLPLRATFDYLQGWLDDLEPLAGEPLDLRTLLREELGFDIDVALFDWIGDEFYAVQLEPISTDLRTLLYQPAQALIVPVTDPVAAQRGGEALGEAFKALFSLFTDDADLPSGMFDSLTETYDYDGIPVTRYRFSFNTDTAVAYLDNYMIVASPASALPLVIDSYRAAAPAAVAGLEGVLAARPAGVSSYYYSDDRIQLQGLANLARLVTQPLAFVLSAASQERSFDDPFMYSPMSYSAGLPEGIIPTPLMVPGTLSGILEPPVVEEELEEMEEEETEDTDADATDTEETDAEEADTDATETEEIGTEEMETLPFEDFSFYGDEEPVTTYYELVGLNVGDSITVTLDSTAFDTYLFLIDPEADLVLDENDDYLGSLERSRITFTVEVGVTYWLEVTSFSRTATGAYTLEVVTTPPVVEEVRDVPTFAELLQALEIVPNALDLIAARLSTSEGYSETREGGVYSRFLIRVLP